MKDLSWKLSNICIYIEKDIMQRKNLILDLTFEFSIKTIDLYVKIYKYNLSAINFQLLKSGTSIGANVEEAIAAQSRKDFISKLSISLKEARETRYWLRLLERSKIVPIDFSDYLKNIEVIIKILSKIIITTKGD